MADDWPWSDDPSEEQVHAQVKERMRKAFAGASIVGQPNTPETHERVAGMLREQLSALAREGVGLGTTDPIVWSRMDDQHMIHMIHMDRSHIRLGYYGVTNPVTGEDILITDAVEEDALIRLADGRWLSVWDQNRNIWHRPQRGWFSVWLGSRGVRGCLRTGLGSSIEHEKDWDQRTGGMTDIVVGRVGRARQKAAGATVRLCTSEPAEHQVERAVQQPIDRIVY